MPPVESFAGSPIFKIAFAVPNLDQAIKDYSDLFGISAASATRSRPPMTFPKGFTGDRGGSVRSAALRFPNGVLLELNEPQGGGSIWRSHLQKHGRSLFSVGFRVKSVRDQVAYLTAKGGTLVLVVPSKDHAIAYDEIQPGQQDDHDGIGGHHGKSGRRHQEWRRATVTDHGQAAG